MGVAEEKVVGIEVAIPEGEVTGLTRLFKDNVGDGQIPAMDQCFSSPWDQPGNRGSDTSYLDVGVHENPNEYGGAILESGIIELPATEVSSSPWSCNRNRKAVGKSTSPTEITF